MDEDFKQFLEAVLLDEDLTKTVVQSNEIADRLYEPNYGVCLGCKAELKQVLWQGKKSYSHTDSGTLESCTYSDAYGIVPEWAFFPKEIFED